MDWSASADPRYQLMKGLINSKAKPEEPAWNWRRLFYSRWGVNKLLPAPHKRLGRHQQEILLSRSRLFPARCSANIEQGISHCILTRTYQPLHIHYDECKIIPAPALIQDIACLARSAFGFLDDWFDPSHLNNGWATIDSITSNTTRLLLLQNLQDDENRWFHSPAWTGEAQLDCTQFDSLFMTVGLWSKIIRDGGRE